MAEETPAPVPSQDERATEHAAQPEQSEQAAHIAHVTGQNTPVADLSEPLPKAFSELVSSAAVSQAASEAAPEKRRRIRTRTLLATALVLGVVGGVAGGYIVQARREPTALPPLTVAQPVYPRSPLYDGTRPSSLPANVDDAAIADGDLTKLLLPTPSGAKATFNDHGWMSLAEEADTCENPANCFANNVSRGVARIADTAWNRGDGLYVEIRIFQYRAGDSGAADNLMGSFVAGDSKQLPLPVGIPVVGYEYKDKYGSNDDHALAMHGNLAVYFWVTSTTSVPDPSVISDLITQQMARL